MQQQVQVRRGSGRWTIGWMQHPRDSRYSQWLSRDQVKRGYIVVQTGPRQIRRVLSARSVLVLSDRDHVDRKGGKTQTQSQLKPRARLQKWLTPLSRYGTIQRDGSYWYLHLPTDWQQSNVLKTLRQTSEEVFWREAKRAQRQFQDHYKIKKKQKVRFQWLTPLSPSGLHISLEEQKKQSLGRPLSFRLVRNDQLSLFAVASDDIRRSDFSPSHADVYPLLWSKIDVESAPQKKKEIRLWCPHECHISVAIFAAILTP